MSKAHILTTKSVYNVQMEPSASMMSSPICLGMRRKKNIWKP